MSKLFFPLIRKDILEIEKDWTVKLYWQFEQNVRFYHKFLGYDNDDQVVQNDSYFQITLPHGIKLVVHRYRLFDNRQGNVIFQLNEIPEEIEFYWGLKFNQVKLRKYQKICVKVPDLNKLTYNHVGKIS
jgi:hypothetical protein